MSQSSRSVKTLAAASLLGVSLAVAPLVAMPALANTAGTGVVINEAYLSGGSAGAAYTNKFVELYNPTTDDIDLSSMSLQYRKASGTGADSPSGVFPLSGSIPAGGYFLISGGSNGTNGIALPTPNTTTSFSPAGAAGTIILAASTSALTLPVGDSSANAEVVDLIGYGSSLTFESAVAPAPRGNTDVKSLNRTAFSDTDQNNSDISLSATITPTNAVGETTVPEAEPDPEPTTPPSELTEISAIQGATDTSPVAGTTVLTEGVITAAYPTGGFNGFYLQTAGTGGAIDLGAHTASDAVFVYTGALTVAATIGDFVSVVGAVSEFKGLTEVTIASAADVVVKDASAIVAPTPVIAALPTTDAARETLEGMLFSPQGDFTVTNNYTTNQYAEVGLATGTTPLVNPTVTAIPGSDEYTNAVAANAARSVTLDDGASISYTAAANQGSVIPYLSAINPVRIGAAATFTKPVVLDYRNDAWKFQPVQALTAANASSVQPATFSNAGAGQRSAQPDNVGGDIRLASFNVLNYFSTTGDTQDGCSYYLDRAGNQTTVSGGCDVRGAANQDDLLRQQAKIVAAINALNADVVSLEEIENSAKFGKNRDDALGNLVAALNQAAGSEVWAFAASPTVLPASEDVIRTGFIYKPASVETVGNSVILADSVAFNGRAREPLAQAFQLKGDDSTKFLAIVNHFKSKGSGTEDNADQGDGQGASNPTRVEQANALVAFATQMKTKTGIDKVFLTGDFNAYDLEDPIKVITDAGYISQGAKTGEYSYAYGGTVGSLDHIFASSAADAVVNDVDIWNINSVESVALEYSRYNNNVTDYYQAGPYRSSDHDPIVLGLELSDAVNINLLNINDFHGRIDGDTVRFAGTVEQLRAQYGDESSLFLSDGDNIGASLFASASQKDSPTIAMLNKLELAASAVGNHEFDQGLSDLTGRVQDESGFTYLGANVYEEGTSIPALPEYAIFTVDGVRVAVIGAVTQETPSLVSPDGISMLSFGNPVDAVNRVAAQIVSDDLADVIVAEYHEGAGAGTPDGATLDEELALEGSAFENIVSATSAEVDAIFTGHTHKQYAWNAPVPGATDGATRPVLQTGSYGENIGQVVLRYDPTTSDTTTVQNRNVKRLTGMIATTGTSAEQSTAQKAANAALDGVLIGTYRRVSEVDGIVKEALIEAAIIGSVKVGSLTADVSRACLPGASGCVEDRAAPSAMGSLVANALLESLSDETIGGAEIGVVNPGGMRTGLSAGDVTYAQANGVLPFLNNLWTTTLTGAQFKTVLEQQWQTNPDGSIPSRPYLQLGLSDNVNYTFDASKAAGSRITGIWIDGSAIDPKQDYRIGSFNFLLTGGDNFREFTKGTNTKDSGLVDRDAWVSYISAKSPLSPSFVANQASVTGTPAAAVNVGDTVTLTVSGLNLPSTGAPTNSELAITFGGDVYGSVPVDGTGTATVAVTVPANAAVNSEIVLTAKESGTIVRIDLTVNRVSITEPVGDPTGATDPTITTEPTVPAQAADVSALVPVLEDVITLGESTYAAGETVLIDVGEQYAGRWVSVWMRSSPVQLGGWQQVSPTGFVIVTLPANTPPGIHRIIVQDTTGAVIGWSEVKVTASTLSSTGVNATPWLYGAALMLLLGAVLVMRRRRSEFAEN